MSLRVRQLGAEDAPAYRALRLSGLETDPRAFASDYATEAGWPLAEFEKRLTGNLVFGGFEGEALLAAVGYFVPGHRTMAHRGHVWGMIVSPDARGRGVGKRVLSALVADARRAGLRQLHLGVGTYNHAAIGLYTGLGFTIYGTEPRALRIGNQDIDEHQMVLFLDKEDL